MIIPFFTNISNVELIFSKLLLLEITLVNIESYKLHKDIICAAIAVWFVLLFGIFRHSLPAPFWVSLLSKIAVKVELSKQFFKAAYAYTFLYLLLYGNCNTSFGMVG